MIHFRIDTVLAGRGGLGEERKTEGRSSRELFSCGAAVRAWFGADGQHVLLEKKEEEEEFKEKHRDCWVKYLINKRNIRVMSNVSFLVKWERISAV